MKKLPPLLLALALFAFAQSPVAAPVKNGFDLATAEIPPDDILRGGPPRDGIPAVHDPKFVPADAATFLAPDDRVLGLVVDETARAYPVRILDWHEIVNDRIGDTAFAVTYCPLCGSGVVFRANVGGEQLSFGVSGLLYKSDVLLYDLQTETLWSQLLRRAVSGELRGTRLQSLPVVHTTWRDWKTRHPDSQVLSDRHRTRPRLFPLALWKLRRVPRDLLSRRPGRAALSSERAGPRRGSRGKL